MNPDRGEMRLEFGDPIRELDRFKIFAVLL